MNSSEPLIGRIQGRLTAIRRLPDSRVLCQCVCGGEKEMQVSHFNSGKMKSCGCHVKKAGRTKVFPSEAELAAIAREWLDYDSKTGHLFWKKKGRKAIPGARAGTVGTHGYRQVYIGGKSHREHRICWLVVNGEFPSAELDHINGRKDDNRMENLRVVTRAENLQNIHDAHARSSSGVRGVRFDRRRGIWTAEIQAFGVKRFLGAFSDKGAAEEAYRAAKRRLHIGGAK